MLCIDSKIWKFRGGKCWTEKGGSDFERKNYLVGKTLRFVFCKWRRGDRNIKLAKNIDDSEWGSWKVKIRAVEYSWEDLWRERANCWGIQKIRIRVAFSYGNLAIETVRIQKRK